jgi:hypothetical protein
MASTDTRDGITLTCTPEKQGDTIVLAYTLANAGPTQAYAADAMPKIDPQARTATPDPDAVAVWLTQDRFATVLKGVAALPQDRDVPYTVMPLMAALPPGARIERTLSLSLPLAEHGPYHGLANVRDYRLTEIEGITLAIDVLARLPEGFAPKPVAYAPDHLDIGMRGTLPLLTRLTCRFPARGLQLMMRIGAYPRPD